MNITDIILSGNLYKSYNKCVEDELINSSTCKDGLHDIDNDEISKLFLNISKENITDLINNINDEFKDNVVITGNFIRSIFSNNKESENTCGFIKKCDIHILDNNNNTTINNTLKSKLIDYSVSFFNNSSLWDCIINEKYINRVLYFKDKIYVSTMFIVEYHKNIWAFTNNIIDPVYKTPTDVLSIYNLDVNKNDDIKTLIDTVNIDKIKQLNKDKYNKCIVGNKTLIEYCIKSYIDEKNSIIKNNKKEIIIYLNSNKLLRPAFLYAKLIELNKLDICLFNILCETENIYNIQYDKKINIMSQDDIDYIILTQIILQDNYILFDTYLKFFDIFCSKKKNLIKKIIDFIIITNAKDISKYIVSSNKINETYIYNLILYSENFDLLELFTKFKIDIAINYLEDIVKKGLIRSFYYLVKNDKSAIHIKFTNNNNILHICENTKNSTNIIKLALKLNNELINEYNDLKKTPLIMQTEKGNVDNVIELLKHGANQLLFDSKGETLLHKIAREGHIEMLKQTLSYCKNIINVKNSSLETAIMLSCKHGNEELFYILKDETIDTTLKDINDNTIYHYICLNGICIGHTIINSVNKFGYTPQNYCKFASGYYNFIG